MGHGLALTCKCPLLNLDPFVQDVQIISGLVIGIFDDPFRVGSLLNKMLGPF